MAVTWKKIAYEEDVVTKALFDANTILAANTDDTPAAITIAEDRVVGRKSGGNITALTKSDLLTLLNVEDGADATDATSVAAAGAVMDDDFTAADEVMVGTGAGTHTQVTLGASEFLAKKASGTATNVSASEARTILNVEDGADVTDATNVAAAGAIMESDIVAADDLIVGTGSGTAGILSVGSLGEVLKVGAGGLEWAEDTTGSGDFKADGSVPMTGDLDFDDNEATDMVFQQVADEAAVSAYATPVVGKVLFATSEKTLHICTSAT